MATLASYTSIFHIYIIVLLFIFAAFRNLLTFFAGVRRLLLLHTSFTGFGTEDYVQPLHVAGVVSFFLANFGPVEEEYLPPLLQYVYN